ncbi:hypothetical protein F5B17DRAFT_380189 [Nemania serpens]|nr:hypothetical protein F5B17DRAFT_380189 [Nemania serpens]
MCLPPEAVFKLADTISLEVGALVEPLAVAWHAVRESGITAGQASLVLGAGPIGLAIIQCLKAIGAGEIMAVELASGRQTFAKQFGATHILDPSKVDVVKEARKLTGGQGPAVAFDCAGVASSLDSATRAVCARGTIIYVAICEKPVPFHSNNIVFSERKLIGSLAYIEADFQQVINALCEGRLRPESMITSKISIDRVVEDGFDALVNEKDKHVKILVDLSAS